jgi:hypothetical protein
MGLHPFCFCPNSPECVEVEFCELRVDGVLRSSRRHGPTRFYLSFTEGLRLFNTEA